jgi:uncharacterized LabA/DUF88 family protein
MNEEKRVEVSGSELLKVSCQRIGVFVDVQNMFYSARHVFNGKIDYSMLLNEVVANRQLVRAIAYAVQRPNVPQDGFFDALGKMGYELRVKEVRNRTDGEGNTIPAKGSYEVMLAIDVVEASSKLDVVTIVSGDGQYAPLIRYLKSRGCKVEVVSFDGTTSKDLLNIADKFIMIPKGWTFGIKEKEKVDDEKQPIVDTPIADSPEDDEKQPESNCSSFGIFAPGRK